MSLTLITPNGTFPLSTNEVEEHLRRDDLTVETNILPIYKAAALDAVEKYLGRPIMTQTFEYSFDDFPWETRPDNYRYGARAGVVQLPLLGVTSITSVKYTDVNGAEQTRSNTLYQVDLGGDSCPARLVPAPTSEWPLVQQNAINGVRVRFAAGWATAGAVPPIIKAGILVTIHDLYVQHGTQIVGTITAELPNHAVKLMGFYRNRFAT